MLSLNVDSKPGHWRNSLLSQFAWQWKLCLILFGGEGYIMVTQCKKSFKVLAHSSCQFSFPMILKYKFSLHFMTFSWILLPRKLLVWKPLQCLSWGMDIDVIGKIKAHILFLLNYFCSKVSGLTVQLKQFC